MEKSPIFSTYARPEPEQLQELAEARLRLDQHGYRYHTPEQIIHEFNRGRTIASIAREVFRSGRYTKMRYATDYVQKIVYDLTKGEGTK